MVTSKDVLRHGQTAEFANSLGGVSSCDVDFKREALKKIDSACY